jgi:hypothetical protein
MSRALVRRKGGEGYKKYKRVVQSGGTISLDTCVFERRTDKLYGSLAKIKILRTHSENAKKFCSSWRES